MFNEPSIAFVVALFLVGLVVWRPVKLHHQLRGQAGKVRDGGTNRRLTAKLYADATISEAPPKHLLNFRRAAPHGAGAAELDLWTAEDHACPRGWVWWRDPSSDLR